MALPQLPQKQTLEQLQTKWAAGLRPVLSNPIVDGNLVQNVALLSTQTNQVNHGLGRKLVGWIITRYQGNYAQIYDTQASNPNPQLTLFLNANTNVTVDLYVF